MMSPVIVMTLIELGGIPGERLRSNSSMKIGDLRKYELALSVDTRPEEVDDDHDYETHGDPHGIAHVLSPEVHEHRGSAQLRR